MTELPNHAMTDIDSAPSNQRPFALRRQQLDQLGAAVGLRGAEDLDEVRTEIGHQHSCVRASAGSPRRVACSGPRSQGWRGRETRW